MDHGRPNIEESMALGGSPSVDEVVAAWRRDFVEVDAIRSDDVEELCDHFRDVVEARLDAGDPLDDAVDAARSQVGRPDRLIQEMARAHRPPRHYRRWCVALALYAVVQATLILAWVAELSISAYRTGISLPAQATGTYEISAGSVLIGLILIMVISWRFGLASAGRGMAKPGSALASVSYIVGLGIVLLLALSFADFWQWWLQAENQASPNPWDTAPWVLLIGTGGPVLALTVATILRRWHPALRPFTSEPITQGVSVPNSLQRSRPVAVRLEARALRCPHP